MVIFCQHTTLQTKDGSHIMFMNKKIIITLAITGILLAGCGKSEEDFIRLEEGKGYKVYTGTITEIDEDFMQITLDSGEREYFTKGTHSGDLFDYSVGDTIIYSKEDRIGTSIEAVYSDAKPKKKEDKAESGTYQEHAGTIKEITEDGVQIEGVTENFFFSAKDMGNHFEDYSEGDIIRFKVNADWEIVEVK